MAKTTPEALAARLDVQAIALQELARVLTTAQAGAVADALRHRVAAMASADLSNAEDVAIAAKLAQLLAVLEGK